jgi:hypothetical protein
VGDAINHPGSNSIAVKIAAAGDEEISRKVRDG